MLLRLGLEIADRVVSRLPARLAYALADLAGDAWYRAAEDRRRLVAANLSRVCAATDRPTSGPVFRNLVRDAFRNHARYYLELLRAPHYDVARADEFVRVDDWDAYAEALGPGPSMLVSCHLGNFEPFALFLARRGYRPLAPVEEIEPPELFAFIAEHRGGGAVQLVPLSRARSALTKRLREGGLVGIIGDRVVEGSGHPVTMFGHPTVTPLGPATLAVTHRVGLVVGRCLRSGPDRFVAVGEPIEVPDSGDRRADIVSLAERMAARYERDIGEAPEQWWGAFQPYWPDLDPGRAP
jgi:phosphatidylinositol dimannoside acyltransferase